MGTPRSFPGDRDQSFQTRLSENFLGGLSLVEVTIVECFNEVRRGEGQWRGAK